MVGFPRLPLLRRNGGLQNPTVEGANYVRVVAPFQHAVRTSEPGEATTCVPGVAHGWGVTKRLCRVCSAHTSPGFPCFLPVLHLRLARRARSSKLLTHGAKGVAERAATR